MIAFLKLLAKWLLKIPVLFAHFPGPSVLLVVVAGIAAGTMASCVTHQLEAGARAELKIELASCQVEHAQAVAKAAVKREGVIEEAAGIQRAIDSENRRVWFAQMQQLVESAADKAMLAKLAKSIEDLHHDAAFDCRRLPLPDSYLRGVRFESWKAGADPDQP